MRLLKTSVNISDVYKQKLFSSKKKNRRTEEQELDSDAVKKLMLIEQKLSWMQIESWNLKVEWRRKEKKKKRKKRTQSPSWSKRQFIGQERNYSPNIWNPEQWRWSLQIKKILNEDKSSESNIEKYLNDFCQIILLLWNNIIHEYYWRKLRSNIKDLFLFFNHYFYCLYISSLSVVF